MNAQRPKRQAKQVEELPIEQELRPWRAIDKQEQLFSRYPLFFRPVHFPEAYPSNLAFFGIQCGLGWYPVIELVAQEIEELFHAVWKDQAEFPDNLASIDRKLLLGPTPSDALFPVLPYCYEIRETEGKLRIAVTSGSMLHSFECTCMHEFAKHAEFLAQTVCERCGKPGEFRKGYWDHVYCDECVSPPTFKVKNAE
ncbi:hypothetical protein P3T40_004505 [Paraburkholderia sp. EB58]|uniref:hypothetical protein n=1 Tax=Paraburkholderia sp. EB58 TaxID=3035125 RepID=UPI003D1916E3